MVRLIFEHLICEKCGSRRNFQYFYADARLFRNCMTMTLSQVGRERGAVGGESEGDEYPVGQKSKTADEIPVDGDAARV